MTEEEGKNAHREPLQLERLHKLSWAMSASKYVISIDLEFTGVATALDHEDKREGQVVEIGASVKHVPTDKQIAEFDSGLIQLEPGHKWDEQTYTFWKETLPERLAILLDSEASERLPTLKQAMDRLFQWLDATVETIEPGTHKRFLFDTHGCDVTLLSILFEKYGDRTITISNGHCVRRTLHKWFGGYRDMLSLDEAETAAKAALYVRGQLHKWNPPVLDSALAHIAVNDAKNIADRYCYAIRLILEQL